MKKSTIKNPYMNALPYDKFTENKANYNSTRINENFLTGTENDPTKQWCGNNFDRYYYTQPVSSTISNLDSYLDFLYPDTDTCRKSGYDCYLNMDTTTAFDRMVTKSTPVPSNIESEYKDVSNLYDKVKLVNNRIDSMQEMIYKIKNKEEIVVENNLVNKYPDE
jgi:hypothetical protein